MLALAFGFIKGHSGTENCLADSLDESKKFTNMIKQVVDDKE